MPAPPADCGECGDERIELRDVVHVRGGNLRHKRDAARVGDEMMLGTCLAAIGRVRASFSPAHRAD
jgi:hypothetical protein